MNNFVNIIPLIIMIILLLIKTHMLIAGFAAGITAVIIGGITLDTVNELFLKGISDMMVIVIPILYAATAGMVSKGGSMEALVKLAEKSLKNKLAILAGFIVLIQGFAAYAAGNSAATAIVIAPLMAMAVGAIPEVIGAMAILSAVAFTTTVASPESAFTAESSGIDILSYSNLMFPFTVGFFVLGVCLAIYGVKRRQSQEEQFKSENSIENGENNKKIMIKAIPFISLLILIVFGPVVNNYIGIQFFSPPVVVIIVTLLTMIFSDLSMNETAEALVEGSRFILTTLFSVGIFLGFVNLIAELGTFEQLAELIQLAPDGLILPTAMVISFLIAVPSGAFTAGVLALILPTLSTLGLSPLAMGFVAIATGLGAQLSPVQINVAAFSQGFDLEITDIIKINTPYIIGMLVIIMATAMIVV